MHEILHFVTQLGPNPIGNWICFIMLALAVLVALTQSSHLAMLELFVVFVGIGTGWAMGF
jgi:hypothetical protein